MKLLFDQNISFRVLHLITDIYPDSVQVSKIGLQNSTDSEIWSFAAQNGFTIVTFDADFADLQSIKGFPPKIIWLRFFDQRTSVVSARLIAKQDVIKDFIHSKEFGILEIN